MNEPNKWKSTPQALRHRKMVGFTLSPKAIKHLKSLLLPGESQSGLVERLIEEAYKARRKRKDV